MKDIYYKDLDRVRNAFSDFMEATILSEDLINTWKELDTEIDCILREYDETTDKLENVEDSLEQLK